MERLPFISFLFFLFSGLSVSPGAEEYTSEQIDFFEKRIRPVLAEKCYSCHSATAKKLKAHLHLDHREHMLTGGDTGPSIVPGKPNESLLVEVIRYETPDLQMPPKGPLDQRIVADFEKWIADGAAWPKEPLPKRGAENQVAKFDLKKRFNEHWSWRVIDSPEPPRVENAELVKTPIDRFVLAKVEDAGITPAEPAEKRTWLRRVTFDLIGLPPSKEEIASFLADDSEQARETVVDRLLSSKHFGEKWARHWMDLVRYADTCGHEFDYPIPYAHEYRDYLIRAFNLDLPYDQFIQEHLAGDLLAKPRLHPEEQFNESVIATGFWYFHDATHAPTDVLQDEADHQENQIDVMGKAFQALTIACARCHDHKFDAISTADYYALTGYLHGSARTDFPLDPGRARHGTATRQKLLRARATALLTSPEQTLQPGTCFLKAAQLVREKLAEPKPDPWDGILFEDFESGYDGWKVEGKAMGTQPAGGPFGNQKPLVGFRGKGVVNSFHGDDKLVGKLISDPFVIAKPFVNFLVGGGKSGQTRVEIQIDGKPVRQTFGKNDDKMIATTWEVSKWIGKTARIWIIDNSGGGWGHINADHFVFSDHRVDQPYRPVPNQEKIAAAAAQSGLDPGKLKAWCNVLTSVEAKPDTPEGFLTRWVKTGKPGRVPNWDGFNKELFRYRKETSLFADFSGEALPVGWSSTGEAFLPAGNEETIRFDPKTPIASPGTVDSGILGRKHVGTLRTPPFEISAGGIHIRLKSEKVTVRAVIDNYHMAHFNGLLFRGTSFKDLNTEGQFRWHQIAGDLKKYIGHRAYLEFIDSGDGFAVIDEIRFGDRRPPSRKPHPLLEEIFPGTSLGSDEKIGAALDAAWKTGNSEVLNWFARNNLGEITDLNPQLAALITDGVALAKNLPPARFAVSMAQGGSEKGRIYIRGSHRNHGPEVANRYLEALGATEGTRLDLANQIASDGNPLTARVMVNRLWHHLFGRGIVPTVDDFGPMGESPSHPDLLDWLAADFMDGGWSVKNTIRRIALSNTYGQASTAHPDNDSAHLAVADPENVLLHRMPVRRLTAEAIRDSILAVSGRLDRKMFGASIPTHRTSFMTGRGARGSGPLDGAGRRTLYGATYRNFLSPLLLTFDQPSPFGPKGRRSVSNVPAQSLALMNDPFVIEQAKTWADLSLKEAAGNDRDRISRMYEKAIGKPPTKSQLNTLKSFLDQQAAEYGKVDQRAWSDLAHVIINLKDFIYLN